MPRMKDEQANVEPGSAEGERQRGPDLVGLLTLPVGEDRRALLLGKLNVGHVEECERIEIS